ncbi:hypothetical protein F5Y17DRAFT_139037 [Xylariaceae sp. FL0594]|nr:hypothetical protein F5Y17DRAFT_139037 [Xylariaceae sp. FL0594]
MSENSVSDEGLARVTIAPTAVESRHKPPFDELFAPPIPPRRRLHDRAEPQIPIYPSRTHGGDVLAGTTGLAQRQDTNEDDSRRRNGHTAQDNTAPSISLAAIRRQISVADSMSAQGDGGPSSLLFSDARVSSAVSSDPTEASFLPALQDKTLAGYELIAVDESDAESFDLISPAMEEERRDDEWSIEARSALLYSVDHLKYILDDPVHSQKFTGFLKVYRPESMCMLQYYMKTEKALKALEYANALARDLGACPRIRSSEEPVREATGESLVRRATEVLEVMAREDLPAYVTHIWSSYARTTIKQRIANTLASDLRGLSEGSGDVFCLTDPSRVDNPIIFASEEFHQATQYGRRYTIGHNCRFLQGPKTDPVSIVRLRDKLAAGKDHCEVLLNYRRDGSTFVNLLTVVPLRDINGHIRYHLGSQVDITGLLKGGAGLPSLQELVALRMLRHASSDTDKVGVDEHKGPQSSKEALAGLARALTLNELRIIHAAGESEEGSRVGDTSHGTSPSRESGTDDDGKRQQQQQGEGLDMAGAEQEKLTQANTKANSQRSRMSYIPDINYSQPSVSEPSPPSGPSAPTSSPVSVSPPQSSVAPLHVRFQGALEHYLLVRPFPSLRILFASPSLRVPGMLQSELLQRVGGDISEREVLREEFRAGRSVTAKICWLPRPSTDSELLLSNKYSSYHIPRGQSPFGDGRCMSELQTPIQRRMSSVYGRYPTLRGKSRWIHTTPLLGSDLAVGVWVVSLVDDEAPQGQIRSASVAGIGKRSSQHVAEPKTR